jgi:hypothetical protein
LWYINVDGFYDSLLKLIENAVAEKFIRKENAEFILSDSDPDILIHKIKNWNPVIIDKWISK